MSAQCFPRREPQPQGVPPISQQGESAQTKKVWSEIDLHLFPNFVLHCLSFSVSGRDTLSASSGSLPEGDGLAPGLGALLGWPEDPLSLFLPKTDQRCRGNGLGVLAAGSHNSVLAPRAADLEPERRRDGHAWYLHATCWSAQS